MFFLFGWGHQTIWHLGPAFLRVCSNCNNEKLWTLSRYTTWFTLFFIPVIPYKTEWLVTCPVCHYGSELNSKQVEEMRPIAELNKKLMDGNISKQEHHSKMLALENEDKGVTKEIDALPEPQELEQEANTYCGECGKETSTQSNFCVSCGTKLTQTI